MKILEILSWLDTFSGTIKAESGSLMQLKWEPAPHSSATVLRIPRQILVSSSSRVPMSREISSAMSRTQQHYHEHPKMPLLPDHSGSVNLQGNSS